MRDFQKELHIRFVYCIIAKVNMYAGILKKKNVHICLKLGHDWNVFSQTHRRREIPNEIPQQ